MVIGKGTRVNRMDYGTAIKTTVTVLRQFGKLYHNKNEENMITACVCRKYEQRETRKPWLS